MRNDSERLRDIQEAIQRLEQCLPTDNDLSLLNPIEIAGVVWHLQLIGEAAAKLSESFKESHPEIKWKAIIRSRNIFVHQYFDIDLTLVQAILSKELPLLKAQIQAILDCDAW